MVSLPDASWHQRGQVCGIAALVVAILSAFAWLPLNLGAAALATALSVAGILQGERKYSLITPVVVAAVLLFLSPVTLTIIFGLAQHGNPGLLLLVLVFVGAPWAAVAYDNARREGRTWPTGADFRITVAGPHGPSPRPSKNNAADQQQLLLIPKIGGRPFRVGYNELLKGRAVILGRKESSDLVLPDLSVSREHAQITATRDLGPAICDLGSANGTFVNGQRIGKSYVALSGAKSIRLGECEVTVELPDER
jgi:pSer/pThr/pTyr-binding forkhead associated (FHA) protein